MESFQRITAVAAPLPLANIDTDQIIPTRFLARVSEAGLDEGLFAEWRVRADGSPNPDFVLNQAPWRSAQILVAGPNFGCGSSREAAPRALRQAGFRALIAPSYGDIFFNNCFRNGIVPVRLPGDAVDALAAALQRAPGTALSVDLEAQTVRLGQSAPLPFNTPPRLRRMLLEGLDEIALTQTMAGRIDGFRHTDRALRPWAYLDLPGA